MRFFSTLLASILGTLLGLGILFLLGFLTLASLMVATEGEPSVRKGSVLKLELSGALPEHQDESLASLTGLETSNTVRDVTEALEKAAADERIAAAWLIPDGLSTSWAAALEIRRALKTFRASGKPLYASSGPGGFSEGDYFFASAADSVMGTPEGDFELNGFSVSVTFYADLLRKLDVEPLVVRAGTYKSGVEPFTRRELSPENAGQLQLIASRIDSLYAVEVSSDRSIPVDRFQQLQAASRPRSTREALEVGLVDALAFPDEVEAQIRKRLGLDEDADLPEIGLASYSRVSRSKSGLSEGSEGTVAVVYAVGEIVSGSEGSIPLGGGAVVADEAFTKTLDRVREDRSVKAVVLRIDSPGGSAAASDVIWRAVSRLAQKKPLVTSFGGVAASGGYYIAAPARRIFAEPVTITGSIGVYGLMLNVGTAMEKNLGITFDQVKTDPHADMFSGVRSWTADEQRIMEQKVDMTYKTFLNRVAGGRGMAQSTVRTIADGRVWTGFDGLRVGLVDELGGLDAAITFAAKEAGLSEGTYRIRILPRPKSFLERLESLPMVATASSFRDRPVDSHGNPIVAAALRLKGLVDRPWRLESRLPLEIRVQ